MTHPNDIPENPDVEEFGAAQLLNLDRGQLLHAIDLQLMRIMDDIAHRPIDHNGNPTKPRKLTMTFHLTPIVRTNEDTHVRELVSVDIRPQLKTGIPDTLGGSNVVRRRGGRFLWNKNSPDNFEQRSLPFGKPEPTDVPPFEHGPDPASDIDDDIDGPARA